VLPLFVRHLTHTETTLEAAAPQSTLIGQIIGGLDRNVILKPDKMDFPLN